MTRRRTQAEMAAIEAAVRESEARAEADARVARNQREEGQRLADRIRRWNAENHFARWIFIDGAGGAR